MEGEAEAVEVAEAAAAVRERDELVLRSVEHVLVAREVDGLVRPLPGRELLQPAGSWPTVWHQHAIQSGWVAPKPA